MTLIIFQMDHLELTFYLILITHFMDQSKSINFYLFKQTQLSFNEEIRSHGSQAGGGEFSSKTCPWLYTWHT